VRNKAVLEIHNLPQTVRKFIDSVASANINTAYEYQKRLNYFGHFLKYKYDLSFDGLVDALNSNQSPSINVYYLLSSYVRHLQKKEAVPSASTIKACVTTVKNFLEYWDVEISPRKFKLKVRLPRVVKQSKEALSKEDVVNILNACSSIKLKTYYMFLAAFTVKVMPGSSSTAEIHLFLVLLLLFWSGNTYDYCNKQTNKQTLGIRLTI
jgi:hypothetical protein